MKMRIGWLILTLGLLTSTSLFAEGPANLKTFFETNKMKPRWGEKREIYGTDSKRTLVVGFASWCSFCRAEIPEIVRLYSQYRGCGLDVVGLGVEKDAEATARAVKEWGIPFPVIQDDQYVAKKYLEVKKIPALFLTDSKGLEVAREAGATGAKKMYAHIKEAFKDSKCVQP